MNIPADMPSQASPMLDAANAMAGERVPHPIELHNSITECHPAIGDAFDEMIDFPQAAEIVLCGFGPLDVDELVEHIVLPERASECRRVSLENRP